MAEQNGIPDFIPLDDAPQGPSSLFINNVVPGAPAPVRLKTETIEQQPFSFKADTIDAIAKGHYKAKQDSAINELAKLAEEDGREASGQIPDTYVMGPNMAGAGATGVGMGFGTPIRISKADRIADRARRKSEAEASLAEAIDGLNRNTRRQPGGPNLANTIFGGVEPMAYALAPQVGLTVIDAASGGLSAPVTIPARFAAAGGSGLIMGKHAYDATSADLITQYGASRGIDTTTPQGMAQAISLSMSDPTFREFRQSTANKIGTISTVGGTALGLLPGVGQSLAKTAATKMGAAPLTAAIVGQTAGLGTAVATGVGQQGAINVATGQPFTKDLIETGAMFGVQDLLFRTVHAAGGKAFDYYRSKMAGSGVGAPGAGQQSVPGGSGEASSGPSVLNQWQIEALVSKGMPATLNPEQQVAWIKSNKAKVQAAFRDLAAREDARRASSQEQAQPAPAAESTPAATQTAPSEPTYAGDVVPAPNYTSYRESGLSRVFERDFKIWKDKYGNTHNTDGTLKVASSQQPANTEPRAGETPDYIPLDPETPVVRNDRPAIQSARDQTSAGGNNIVPREALKPTRPGFELVEVDPKLINDEHQRSSPGQSIRTPGNELSRGDVTRTEQAKKYIQAGDYRGAEPAELGFTEDGKLFFTNGRHRLKAAEELGAKSTFVSVPKDQAKQISDQFGPKGMVESARDDAGYRGSHKAPDGTNGEGSLDAMDRTYPDDIYGPQGARYYGASRPDDIQMHRIIQSVRGKPDAEVSVYRAVPKGSTSGINPGDWVTPSKAYASEHGQRFDGGFDVIEQRVKAGDLYTEGNSLQEFGWSPKGDVAQSARDAEPAPFTGQELRQAEKNAKPSSVTNYDVSHEFTNDKGKRASGVTSVQADSAVEAKRKVDAKLLKDGVKDYKIGDIKKVSKFPMVGLQGNAPKVGQRVTQTPDTPEKWQNLFDNVDRARAYTRTLPDLGLSENWSKVISLSIPGGTGELPPAPLRLHQWATDPAAFKAFFDEANGKNPELIRSAVSGLGSLDPVHAVAMKGQLPTRMVALHFMWGALSKMLGPFEQEAGWIKLTNSPEILRAIDQSVAGTFTLTREEWMKLTGDAIRLGPELKAGNNSISNANAFHLTLTKWNGKWDQLTAIINNPKLSGPEMRREIYKSGLGSGSGFGFKVLSFNLLTLARRDMFIGDRWQFVNLWFPHLVATAGEGGVFSYNQKGVPEDTTRAYKSLNTLDNESSAEAVYSLIEDGLQKVADDARPWLEPILGRRPLASDIHWLSWNIIKNEPVGHSSLDSSTRALQTGLYEKADFPQTFPALDKSTEQYTGDGSYRVFGGNRERLGYSDRRSGEGDAGLRPANPEADAGGHEAGPARSARDESTAPVRTEAEWAEVDRKAQELDRRQAARAQAQEQNTNPETRRRGGEQIAQRLVNELRQGGKLTIEEATAALRIVEKLIENGYLDNLSVSVSSADAGQGVRGGYNPAIELVQLFVRNTNRPGIFKRTFAHEVAHHLERMIPAKDLEAARQQFLRERAAWFKDKQGLRGLLGEGNWLEASFSGQDIKDYLAGNKLDPALISKYFIRDMGTGRWRLKRTDETYRLTNFSEYFAEKVSDIAGERDDARPNAQDIPSVWARMKSFFASIKKALTDVFGRDRVEQIWENFQRGEYTSDFKRKGMHGYDRTGGQNPVKDNVTTADYKPGRMGPADAERQARVGNIEKLEPNKPIPPPQSARDNYHAGEAAKKRARLKQAMVELDALERARHAAEGRDGSPGESNPVRLNRAREDVKSMYERIKALKKGISDDEYFAGQNAGSVRDDGENTPIPGGYREAFLQAKKDAGAPEPKQIKWWTDLGHDPDADATKQFLWAIDKTGQMRLISLDELNKMADTPWNNPNEDSEYQRVSTHLDWEELSGNGSLLMGPAHGRIDATGDVLRVSLIQKNQSTPEIKADMQRHVKEKLGEALGKDPMGLRGYDFTDAGPFTGPEVFSARDENGSDVPKPSRPGSYKAFDEMVTGREIAKPDGMPYPYNLKRFTTLAATSKTARANLDGYHLVQQGNDLGPQGRNDTREFRVFSKELAPGSDSPVHEYRIRFCFEPRGPGSAAGGVTVLFTDEGGMEDTTPDNVKIGLISELFERARQAGITDVFVSRDYAGEIDPNELGLFGHVAKTEPDIAFNAVGGDGYNGYKIDKKTAYSARDEEPSGKQFLDTDRLFLEVDGDVNSLYSPTAKKNLPPGSKIQFESLDEEYYASENYGNPTGYSMTAIGKDGEILAEAQLVMDKDRVFTKRPKYLDGKIQRKQPKLEEGWAMTVEMLTGDNPRAMVAVAAEAVERAKMSGATALLLPFKGFDQREALSELVSSLEADGEVQVKDEIDAFNIVFKQNTPDYASAEQGEAYFGIRRDQVYSFRDDDGLKADPVVKGDPEADMRLPIAKRTSMYPKGDEFTDNGPDGGVEVYNMLGRNKASPERMRQIQEFVKDSGVKHALYRGQMGAYEKPSTFLSADGFIHVTDDPGYAAMYSESPGKKIPKEGTKNAIAQVYLNAQNIADITSIGHSIYNLSTLKKLRGPTDTTGGEAANDMIYNRQNEIIEKIVSEVERINAGKLSQQESTDIRDKLWDVIDVATEEGNGSRTSGAIWQLFDSEVVKDLFDKHNVHAIKYLDSDQRTASGTHRGGKVSFILKDPARIKAAFGSNDVNPNTENMFQSARDEETASRPPALPEANIPKGGLIAAIAAMTPTAAEAATRAGQVAAATSTMDLVSAAAAIGLAGNDNILTGLNPIVANMHLLARDTKSPTIRNVAEMFNRLGGNVPEGATETYFDERDGNRRIFRNKLVKAFEPLASLSQKDLTALDQDLAAALAGEKTLTGPEGQVVDNLKNLSNELFDYLAGSGIKVNYAQDYGMPHSFDVPKLMQDEPAFLSAATRAYQLNNPMRIQRLTGYLHQVAQEAQAKGWTAKLREREKVIQDEINELTGARPAAQAQALLEAISTSNSGGDSTQGLLLEPKGTGQNKANFTRERIFEPAARQILREYFNNDPRHAWNGYIARATTLAEFARRFGGDGSKWTAMVKQMRAEKVSNKDITRIKNMVLDSLGVLNQAPTEGHALAVSVLGLSNMAKLKGTALTNFLESQSQGIAGNLTSTITAPIMMLGQFMAHVAELNPQTQARLKNLIGRELSTETGSMELARAVGLMDAAGLHDIMENSAANLDRESDFSGATRTDKLARGISRGTGNLARAYGIEASENAKRAVATRFAASRIDAHVAELLRDGLFARAFNSATSGMTNTPMNPFTLRNEARMRLRRAGVSDSEMAAFAQWWEASRAADFNDLVAGNDAMAKLARKVIRMEASRATVNTSRATKPGGKENALISQDNFSGKLVMSFLNYPATFREQIAKPMARDIGTGFRGYESDAGQSTFYSPFERARMVSRMMAIPAMAVSAAVFLALRAWANGHEDEVKKKPLWKHLVEGLTYTGIAGGKSELASRVSRDQLPPILDEGNRFLRDINREDDKRNGKERAVARGAIRSAGVPLALGVVSTYMPVPVAVVLDQLLASATFRDMATDFVAGEAAPKKTQEGRGQGRPDHSR